MCKNSWWAKASVSVTILIVYDFFVLVNIIIHISCNVCLWRFLGYCVYIAQAEETRTDIHAESVNLTGDGSLDRHGQIADKRKTGGWRAAPLIFGTNFSFEYNLTTLIFLNYIRCWATENCGIVACRTNGLIFGMMMVIENHQN